jgi:hypothetical protein
MLSFTRRISTASIIVLAAITGACADTNPTGIAVPDQPAHSVSIAAATAWTASGPGTVTVVSDGTAGDAVMTYDFSGASDVVYTWDFETTADETATVTLPWSFVGTHYTDQGGSRVVLYAIVNDAVVDVPLDQLTPDDASDFALSGTYTFTLSAGDTYGFRLGGSSNQFFLDPQVSGTFTVGEPEGPVNTAPVLAPIANQDVDEGSTATFTASATDADAGQTITYSLIGAPAGASINPATGVFSWTPTDDDPTATPDDPDTITVRATDSADPAAFDEQLVIVTVFNVAPTITVISAPSGPIALSGGSAVAHVSFSFTDPGSGDTHGPGVFCGNDTVFGGTAGNCTYTAAGVYTVTILVDDDDDGHGIETFEVVVVPEAPVNPVTKDNCKNGGWMAYGFRNQGQCIRFVQTGRDSR